MKSAKFKDSPLGPIPQDWEVKRLGETCSITTGRKDVNEGCEFGQYPFFTCSKEACRANTYSFDGEALLIAGNGDVGNMHYCNGKFEAYQRTYVLMNFTKSVDFIRQYLSAFLMQRLSKDKVGSSMPYIVLGQLAGYSIPFPPLPEQQRIAEALGEVDNLIDSLDAQIEKKRLIAKGVGHDLLSGKKRLPGFKEKWKSVALDEIGVISKGSGISRAESNTGSIPAVRYGEIYTHHDKVVLNYVSRISDAVAQRATPLKKGDVLFAASGETVEEIGKAVAIKDDGVFAGGDTIVFSPYEELPPTFLGHLLNSPYVQEQKSVVGHGATIVHIKPKDIGRLRVSLPAKAEQQAIADLLSEQDATIAALEAKREKYARIKEGMMRDLLTGKVRMKGE